jgi:hypothetical protein
MSWIMTIVECELFALFYWMNGKEKMNKNISPTLLVVLALAGILSLTACGASTPEPIPTIDAAPIQTEAVSTFAAGLTQTALLQPTETPTSTFTPTPSLTPTLGTPSAPAGGIVPTASCYGLTYRQDVTIPDNTAMVPGQTFTKTWKVRNSGTCAWESGFKLISTGGDAMGGTAQALTQSVAPGAEIDVSVAMTAPNKTGLVRGNWRMSTASGTVFGDELYVLINLGGGTTTVTATKTITATAGSNTLTPTVTPTATTAPTDAPTPTTAP